MTYVFKHAFRFIADFDPVYERGFPLAVAQKDFWLCFAPRYDPLLDAGDNRSVDPYARAPTQQLFQEDRPSQFKKSSFPWVKVSSTCIPSVAAMVSSFPFIKSIEFALPGPRSHLSTSLAALSELSLLTDLRLLQPKPEHLSEILDVPLTNLEVRNLDLLKRNPTPHGVYYYSKAQYYNSITFTAAGHSLLPDAQKEAKGRIHKTLRKLMLTNFNGLRDISALAHFENLEELDLTGRDLRDFSPISKLKELRVLHVYLHPRVPSLNSLLDPLTSLDFLTYLNINYTGNILDTHIERIAAFESLEKLRLTSFRASENAHSILLKPQNLPNLREIWLPGARSSLFKDIAETGTFVTLEKLDVRVFGKLDSSDLSLMLKKFPNLKRLFLECEFQNGTDFSPLGELTALSELTLVFDFDRSFEYVSLDVAISKLVNLKRLVIQYFPLASIAEIFPRLRKLEEVQLRDTVTGTRAKQKVLDLVTQGHLPVLYTVISARGTTESCVPELLQDREDKRRNYEQLKKERERIKQQDLEAARREREEESERDSATVKKKKKKK